MGYYLPKAAERKDRYLVKVDEYASYHRNGFLILRNLVGSEDIKKMRDWADEKFVDMSNPRIQMLHRIDPVAEYGLLLPRVLDVVEALVGPDVLALQSMIFYNPPGKGGQGWHQDSYYIRTHPDTLIGAWIALEDADEENGCLWVAPGSHSEPIYPPVDPSTGGLIHAEGVFADLFVAENASNQDDEVNALSKVAQKYDQIVPAIMKAGDVLFFHSHLLHRSHKNRSDSRLRRSYVCHYCNARSWVPWNHGDAFEGDSANEHHILARGKTHLPYAEPAFGTPVELNHGEDGKSMQAGVSMMGMEDGKVMRVSKNDNVVEK
ncbi:MAG: Phytanoyl-CoA dioxygenase [Paenibacillaceae bacterium]|jgi:chlorinating enzyme|nr:Phytanoyl-CoA dioxygenase [Paenibacillaceae bacterium]